MSNGIKLCVSVVCLDFSSKKTLIVFERQDGKEVVNLPSGGVERGESPVFAAWRELYEETGIDVSDCDLVFAGNTLLETPKADYFTMVYAVDGYREINDGFVRNPKDDVYDSRWMSQQEIYNLKSSHRNGFIDGKIKMGISALMAKSDPVNHFHSSWFIKERK